MPIKPENLKRYPPNWKAIVEQVRERSGNRCEGSPDFQDCRAENGHHHPVTGSLVVLTVGHLDHTPEHCDMDNLKHWCQRCHLNYDKEHHQQNAYQSRRAGKAVSDLFGSDA